MTAKALPANNAGFSREYREMMSRRRAVGEDRESSSKDHLAEVREKIVRCLWFDQLIDPGGLRLEDGRRLTVFFPGHWNEGPGPDFRNAEYSFDDGDRARGDVEIHVEASGWSRHGHADDPEYARVGLHVVLRNDLGAPSVAHGSRAIPQLSLERHLSADLAEILKSVDPDGYPRVGCGREGTCCRSLRAFGRDAQWIGRFLDIAGDERILRKADRFAERLAEGPADETLYAALLETMGYSANRGPFRMLARAMPVETLRRFVPGDAPPDERLLHTQSLLFGAAGLLREEGALEPETAVYVADLRACWHRVAPHLGARAEAGIPWNLRRTRPTNHPARRIAGVSVFLARHLHDGLCRALLRALNSVPVAGPESKRCRATMAAFAALFQEGAQAYWARRVAFGPECLPRASRLIGEGRIVDAVVNVVVPLLLAVSQAQGDGIVEHRLHNLYAALRPREENAITRYMRQRVFGDADGGKAVVRTLRRQQALVQLFHDFCESEATTCDACGFLAAVEGRAG